MFACTEYGKPEIWKWKAKIFREGLGISKFSGKDSPASYKYFQPFHNHDTTPQFSLLLLLPFYFLTFFFFVLFQLFFHSTWPSSSNNMITLVIHFCNFLCFYQIMLLLQKIVVPLCGDSNRAKSVLFGHETQFLIWKRKEKMCGFQLIGF